MPVTEIRAGTILIQVIADSLPMVKIGKSPVSFDSQAYRIAKAIFEGETVPLGNYSLFTAPDNPDEAAMLAAILDAWKQGCSHFMILQVIEPFHALVGTIKGQPVDHYVDHETGTIATRKLQGGVLQCNAVNTAAFHKHVRVLHVVQLYDRKDAAFLSKVANSGVKGGALVEEFLASPHNLETSFGAFGN